MSQRANPTLMSRIATEQATLKQLRLDLYAAGDKELAQVVERAEREFNHPALTGAVNSYGVNADAVRR